jgi:Sensors of blue-light using FAD
MGDLAAVAYSSKTTRPMSSRDLESLLIEARAFNEKVQVTGVLLKHEGAFFQYFEGPPSAVAIVYERIKKSPLHHHLVELLNQPVDTRQFTRWHMAFTKAPLTTLQALSNEIWEMALPTLHSQQARSAGLTLLLKFWESAQLGGTSA